MRGSTLEDVAKEVGVSTMTVSRAVNGRPGVGPELRSRILEVAGSLGYRPNRAARGLAGTRTSTLGIVIPDISNPFFSILVKGATDVARAADKNVFIMNTDEDPALERAAIASLSGEAIDGVIVAGSRLSRVALETSVAGFDAAVLVNRASTGPHIDSVNVDDKAGAMDAIAYLLGKGRRRIACIAGPKASLSGRRRLSGYRQGLERGGIRFDPALVERCVPTLEGGAVALAALLARVPTIDAVIAYNDIVAISAMRVLAESGRAVPGDVAVIGCDDVPFASLVHPGLSTMRIDIASLGRIAMSRLLALGEGGGLGPSPVIRPILVARESA